MNLVDVRSYVPDAIIDLLYATSNNITGQKIYDQDVPLLEEKAARALQLAAQNLQNQNLKLVIWDAYRSEAEQTALLRYVHDARYVKPVDQSVHCKGLAVDVTVANETGKYLDMGTDHDDFSTKAHLDSIDVTIEQNANRAILQTAMQTAGFTLWPYEWWHFDYLN